MKVLHILGGKEEYLTPGGDSPIGLYCDEAIYLTGTKDGHKVEVVLILDLLSKEVLEYFPSLFDAGSSICIGGGKDEALGDVYYASYYNEPFKLIDGNGVDLFSGMTANRFSELLTTYCELFGYRDIDVLDLVHALSFELLNPGRMSEYVKQMVASYSRAEATKVARLFRDLSLEEVKQKLLDNPYSLSNRHYVCYAGYDYSVMIYEGGE